MAAHERQEPSPSDRQVVDRLVPVWLAETERHDPGAARRAREGWRNGTLGGECAQDLATWVTARVTDTAFNEDEGPEVEGPAHHARGQGERAPLARGPGASGLTVRRSYEHVINELAGLGEVRTTLVPSC